MNTTIKLDKKTHDSAHNSKQACKFQKLSDILADHGFMTIRLSNDWRNTDFIALQINGTRFFKVHLKKRLYFSKNYAGKNIYIAFPTDNIWYFYPHDETLAFLLQEATAGTTGSWKENGVYQFHTMSADIWQLMAKYRL